MLRLVILLFTSLSITYANEVVMEVSSENTQSTAVEDEVLAQTNTALGIVATNKNSNFSAYFGTTFYTDMRETSDRDKTSYAEFLASLSYKMGKRETISLSLPLYKELSGGYSESLSDAKLSYTKLGLYKNDWYHFYVRGSYVHPTSEDSKRRDEMQFAVELNPTSVFDLSKLTPGLSFIYLPRVKRFFHKYDQARTGANLNQLSLIQYFLFNYSFKDNWNIQTGLVYANSRGYNGRDKDPSYLTSTELSYSKGMYTYLLGLQTGGTLAKPEYGNEKTIQLYDSRSSEVYAGFGINF